MTTPPHASPFFFFFNDTATTEIYTLSLHDALPISGQQGGELLQGFLMRSFRELRDGGRARLRIRAAVRTIEEAQRRLQVLRSEEHTSELQSLTNLVCRLLLDKKNKTQHSAHRQQDD